MAQVVATRSIHCSGISSPVAGSGGRSSSLGRLKHSMLPARFSRQKESLGTEGGSYRSRRHPSAIVAVVSRTPPANVHVLPIFPEDSFKEEKQIRHLKNIQQVGDISNGIWDRPKGRRKTKIVCTIGPSTNTREVIWKLAEAGMNVARLNMSRGDPASHQKVIDLVKECNAQNKDNVIAIMLDTKVSELLLVIFDHTNVLRVCTVCF